MNGYLAWDETVARAVIDTLKAQPGALRPVLHGLPETSGYIAPDRAAVSRPAKPQNSCLQESSLATSEPQRMGYSSNAPGKLVALANQVGTFFVMQFKTNVPEAIADHLRKFWEPRMRDEIKSFCRMAERSLIIQFAHRPN